ncbi:hypothetical protein [Caulobacter sp. Root343]|jgi:hypothetical protein|nr:hypothetical protein [Caulobacter sp. Root343]
MEKHDEDLVDLIDLGAVTEVTKGMMGVDIEGFDLQPHAGLSDD